ncbi:TPR-like protein [Peniophora sp. CONT]|nr:TPR-like protein [Peniophora sp. CONT]
MTDVAEDTPGDAQLQELDESSTEIEDLRRKLALMPEDHPDLVEDLRSLGTALRKRFERFGDIDDIEEAVTAERRAVDLTPEGHPDLPGFLSNLGASLMCRFERLGKVKDLDAAITALHRAVDLTPEEHPGLPGFLSNLGLSLMRRFERLGEVKGIDAAVMALQRAVGLWPEGHPSIPLTLLNLGGSLTRRFERLDEVNDIDAAITALHRAVDLWPEGHPRLPGTLMNLGGSLTRRFKHLGEVKDIDASIAALQLAVDLLSEGHPSIPGTLGNLGVSLMRRFERLGEVKDIDTAITTLQHAVELLPEGHPTMPTTLVNLGGSLTYRFIHLSKVKDINAAITTLQRAVYLWPEGHPHLSGTLMSLGGSLTSRFERLGEFKDIDAAIATLQRAVDLLPEGHPDLSMTVMNLGNAWSASFQRIRVNSYFTSALKAYMTASTGILGPPSVRLDAAVKAVSMLTRDPDFSPEPGAVLSAHSRVLEIIPQVVWLGHGVDRRYDESSKLGKLINAAVSAAVGVGELERAVEWLEAGRSQVWAQILSFRTPLDDLKDHDSALAESLRDIQARLQLSWHRSHTLALPSIGHAEPVKTVNPEVVARAHRDLVSDYEQVLHKVRDLPGFEGFLRPRRFASIISSPAFARGPIVFINVHSTRCDALILSGGAIKHVPFPELTAEQLETLLTLWNKGLRTRNVRALRDMIPMANGVAVNSPAYLARLLNFMWMWVVQPVLSSLEYIPRNPAQPLPHVTWCPTGPLAQLPLHAAGIYDVANGLRVYDYIVSSYTPTLAALANASQDAIEEHSSPSVLIVTQPATPGLPKLQGTVCEGNRLQVVLNGVHMTVDHLNDGEATKGRVGAVIARHPWVHLACHGSQHVRDATQSAFHLYDGPLSLLDLMRIKLENTELAFLSACQTAMGDSKNPEESAHLAAGMLAVGFKGVVATLWSIADEDGPIVVEAYYRELLARLRLGDKKDGAGKEQTGAAYALHEAVRVLRERFKGEEVENVLRWAPFVHFGV